MITLALTGELKLDRLFTLDVLFWNLDFISELGVTEDYSTIFEHRHECLQVSIKVGFDCFNSLSCSIVSLIYAFLGFRHLALDPT